MFIKKNKFTIIYLNTMQNNTGKNVCIGNISIENSILNGIRISSSYIFFNITLFI